jgi:hypothetical protein
VLRDYDVHKSSFSKLLWIKQARYNEAKQLSLLAAFPLQEKISKLYAENKAMLSP